MGLTTSQPYQGKSPLREFSVVYTDRALNLMAQPFRVALKDLLGVLREAYHAEVAVVVPGSGTFAMEAVARQFASNAKSVVVVRNGYFSFRWSQIIEVGNITRNPPTVLKARPTRKDDATAQWAPVPIEELVEVIARDKPEVVFAPHVETSTGIILPDDYLRKLGAAVKAAGGLFVLDCIASGCVWVDMADLNVDVLISAPQKGWSGPACCGFVMLNGRAKERLATTQSTSFSADLKMWVDVAAQYDQGNFKYHTTLPTDALMEVHRSALETKAMGWDNAKRAQWELGNKVRDVLTSRGLTSVAAPGVVVVHTPLSDMVKRFMDEGLQVAAGVPFKCDEPEATQTFRVGLFGLDKITHVDETVEVFASALSKVLASKGAL